MLYLELALYRNKACPIQMNVSFYEKILTLQTPRHFYIQGIKRGPVVLVGQDALYIQSLIRVKLIDGRAASILEAIG